MCLSSANSRCNNSIVLNCACRSVQNSSFSALRNLTKCQQIISNEVTTPYAATQYSSPVVGRFTVKSGSGTKTTSSVRNSCLHIRLEAEVFEIKVDLDNDEVSPRRSNNVVETHFDRQHNFCFAATLDREGSQVILPQPIMVILGVMVCCCCCASSFLAMISAAASASAQCPHTDRQQRWAYEIGVTLAVSMMSK